MIRKSFFKIFILSFFIILFTFIYYKFLKKEPAINAQNTNNEEMVYSTNIIKDVSYTSKDMRGNEYIINSVEGEIDLNDSNTIFLTDVKSIIKLNNSDSVYIVSDFGKYNINNYDTIFSKNVIIYYLDNKITGDYVDFSLERNSMIISKTVVYRNLENTLYADAAEVNIPTKDTKIFMLEEDKKVNIRSMNYNGNN